MNVLLANPRGFCAGVERAIEIVESALELYGAPVYVRHQIVHNEFVVDNLTRRGAIIVDELDSVPDGSTVIFSAHGVSRSVREHAERRGLRVLDATCPLVTKVHIEVERFCREGRDIVLIGHHGHPEVEGTLGQFENSRARAIHLVENTDDVSRLDIRDPESLAYVTQTTLSVDDTRDIVAALQQRFPRIVGPRKSDICYATQNRQDAVKRLADKCDLVLVVGSGNSSNSNRLRDIATQRGTEAHLIDGPEQIENEWLIGKRTVGVTAGASAPELLVQRVVAVLRNKGATSCVENDGLRENVTFVLPSMLRRGRSADHSVQLATVSERR